MSQAEKIVITEVPVTWQDVVAVARFGAVLELSGHAWARCATSRSRPSN